MTPDARPTDAPGHIRFFGSYPAELFTREIRESLQAVLERNAYSRFEGDNAGFVSASVDGRPWTDTMWSRDTGVFLRELTLFGYLGRACLTADCLMRMVRENEARYFTFPEYFKLGEPGAGSELDGTNAIVIGLVLLWERLPHTHPLRVRIADFLTNEKSPVTYIIRMLDHIPLLPGSGEFGGGCGIPGLHYNVVQNYLGVFALYTAARFHQASHQPDKATEALRVARLIEENIVKHLVSEDGAWTWCIDIDSLKPDPAIVDHPINRGFGGLNGVAAMAADVFGFAIDHAPWHGLRPSRRTFDNLARVPLRRELFERYGIWTQFDAPPLDKQMSPSYGHGYALQSMLLFDKMEMATKAADYLAEATFQPPRGYKLDRDCPYYFYERYPSPAVEDLPNFDQGCGALNLVCVAEPLKAARLMVGCDDTSAQHVQFIPRVPTTWRGYELDDWPVLSANGLSRVHVRYDQQGNGAARFCLEVTDGPALSKLLVERRAAGRADAREATNVTHFDTEL